VTTLDDGEIETLCMLHEHTIRELIDGVRRRWRTLQALRAIVRAALTAALVLAVAEMLALGTHGAPRALAAVAVIALVGATAAVLLGLWPLRRVPGDRQVARFIEEQTPSLDDHLVSAVDVSRSPSKAALAELMLSDAAKRARNRTPSHRSCGSAAPCRFSGRRVGPRVCGRPGGGVEHGATSR
jgi:hypothetical protein